MDKTIIKAEMIDDGNGKLGCTVYSTGTATSLCMLVGTIMRNIADNSGVPIGKVFAKAISAASMQHSASVSIDLNGTRDQGGREK